MGGCNNFVHEISDLKLKTGRPVAVIVGRDRTIIPLSRWSNKNDSDPL